MQFAAFSVFFALVASVVALPADDASDLVRRGECSDCDIDLGSVRTSGSDNLHVWILRTKSMHRETGQRDGKEMENCF